MVLIVLINYRGEKKEKNSSNWFVQAEYDLQQTVHASRWNKCKETETRREKMKESVSSCMMTVSSDAVKILSVCIAARQQEPPVLLLLLRPKQQRKEVGGEGGQNRGGCMVDRLGAWIWDKAWRQRKLENSSGWNKGCAPCPPQTLPHFPPAALLTDGSKGGWVDGLEGLKLCSPILEPEESVSSAKVGCRGALVARVAGRVKREHAG